MTVRAAAKFIDAQTTGSPIGVAGFYSVSYSLTTNDDTADASTGGQVDMQVPYSLSAKKADRFIREALAAAALSRTPSMVIDPDDIYIPFAAR